MCRMKTSSIMRTTVDIDDPILKELKRMQRRVGKSLGRLISDLLAVSLANSRKPPKPPVFAWTTKPMAPRIDLADKHAVYDAMDDQG